MAILHVNIFPKLQIDMPSSVLFSEKSRESMQLLHEIVSGVESGQMMQARGGIIIEVAYEAALLKSI